MSFIAKKNSYIFVCIALLLSLASIFMLELIVPLPENTLFWYCLIISFLILYFDNFVPITSGRLFIYYYMIMIILPSFIFQDVFIWKLGTASFIIGLCGIYFSRYIYHKKKVRQQHIDKNIETISKTKYQKLGFGYILAIIALFLTIVIIGHVPTMAGVKDLDTHRVESLQGTGPIRIFINLAPVVGAAFLIIGIKKSKKKFRVLGITLLIGFGLLNSVLLGFRSPLLTAITLVVLIYGFSMRKLTQKFRTNLIIAMILFISLGALMGLYRYRRDFTPENFYSIIYLQLINTNALNLHIITNTFPQKVDFQYGTAYLINPTMMLNPLWKLLGEERVDEFGEWLKIKTNSNIGKGGGMTPTVLGEAYVNFGVYGLIVLFFVSFIYDKFFLEVIYSNTIYSFLRNIFILRYLTTTFSRGISSTALLYLLLNLVFIYLVFKENKLRDFFIKRYDLLQLRNKYTENTCNK
jgi:oligosaccharide repeat unit polymerase